MKKIYSKRITSHPGVSSLIITIILSFSIISIITGLTISVVQEARQASDSDQSARALYAAQAGIEDLNRAINQDQLDSLPRNCLEKSPTDSTDQTAQVISVVDGQDIAITCKFVKSEGFINSGFLPRDQSITYDFSTAKLAPSPDPFLPSTHEPTPGTEGTGFGYMTFGWNAVNTDVTDPAKLAAPAATIYDYPPLGSTSSSQDPATLEFRFSWCPKENVPPGQIAQTFPATSALDPTKCRYSKTFLEGNSSVPDIDGIPTYTTIARPYRDGTDVQGRNLLPTTCKKGISFDNMECHIGTVTATNFPCDVSADPADECIGNVNLNNFMPDLPGFAGCNSDPNPGKREPCKSAIVQNYNLKMTITARYASTNYTFTLGKWSQDPVTGNITPSGGAVVKFPSALLDVTARSGEIYRRISAQKRLDFDLYDALSYGVFSGHNICKNLVIKDDPALAPPYAVHAPNTCEP